MRTKKPRAEAEPVEPKKTESPAESSEVRGSAAKPAKTRAPRRTKPKPDKPAAIGDIDARLRELRDFAADTQTRLAAVESGLTSVGEQISFIPAQVRMIGGKVDGLTTSISESRYRAALLSVLGIHDLVDQTLRSMSPASDGDGADHRRNYEVLRTQLRQILESNGLCEIPAQGEFDPNVHRAIGQVPCDDPAVSGCVAEVVRPGFRTEQSVLRYAEVTVWKHVPAAQTETSSDNERKDE